MTNDKNIKEKICDEISKFTRHELNSMWEYIRSSINRCTAGTAEYMIANSPDKDAKLIVGVVAYLHYKLDKEMLDIKEEWITKRFSNDDNK